jgi:hypothetical protein
MRAHSISREGLISGAIGASVVALWFLILDSLQGRAFYTPITLGSALLGVLRIPSPGDLGLIAAYTVFHYAAFALTGVILVWIIHKSTTNHGLLAGLLLGFVVFETGFYFLSAILSEPFILGDIAWYQIAIGNLLAAGAMSVYLFRTHPSVRENFGDGLTGEQDAGSATGFAHQSLRNGAP